MIKKCTYSKYKKNTLRKERTKENNKKKKKNTQKKHYVKKSSSAKFMGVSVWYERDIQSHQISVLQILCIPFNMEKKLSKKAAK